MKIKAAAVIACVTMIGCSVASFPPAIEPEAAAPTEPEAVAPTGLLDLVRAACPAFDELELGAAIGLTRNLRDRGVTGFDVLADLFLSCDGDDACLTCHRRIVEYAYFGEQ